MGDKAGWMQWWEIMDREDGSCSNCEDTAHPIKPKWENLAKLTGSVKPWQDTLLPKNRLSGIQAGHMQNWGLLKRVQWLPHYQDRQQTSAFTVDLSKLPVEEIFCSFQRARPLRTLTTTSGTLERKQEDAPMLSHPHTCLPTHAMLYVTSSSWKAWLRGTCREVDWTGCHIALGVGI